MSLLWTWAPIGFLKQACHYFSSSSILTPKLWQMFDTHLKVAFQLHNKVAFGSLLSPLRAEFKGHMTVLRICDIVCCPSGFNVLEMSIAWMLVLLGGACQRGVSAAKFPWNQRGRLSRILLSWNTDTCRRGLIFEKPEQDVAFSNSHVCNRKFKY